MESVQPAIGIIDPHAHILPGVDDGARDWDETRAMLEMAYGQGIRTVIATPHYSHRQDPERIRALAARAAGEASRIAPDLTVLCGQEILYFDSIAEALKEGHALTMAGTRHVLVEFMPGCAYQQIYQGLRRLLTSGYHPIVAHVERYSAMREPGRIEELHQAGCLIQMNYRSLEGGFFDRDTRWCRQQVKAGQIDLLGTDAHRKDRRKPEIAESLKWLEKNADPEGFSRMTRESAAEVLGLGRQAAPQP